MTIMLLLITSCKKSLPTEKARQRLNKIGIEYTQEAFNNAVINKDKLAIELFIDSKYDASYVLKDAIAIYTTEDNKDINLIKKLIQNSSTFNVKYEDSLGYRYESALEEAVYQENLEIIVFLLKNGADVNSNNGEPIKKALIRKKNLEIANILIKNGANINIKDEDGSLLSQISAMALIDKKSLEILKYLLDKGINVNDGENGKSEALLLAVTLQDSELVELLLKKGANVNSIWIEYGERYTLYDAAQNNSKIISILNKYNKKQ